MISKNFWLICIFFICCLIIGMIFGYVYKGTEIRNEMGIRFHCNPFTTDSTQRGSCKANITIPKMNITMLIDSTYDDVSIIGS